jgi:hypothetical protein
MSEFGWCANAKPRQLTGLEVSDQVQGLKANKGQADGGVEGPWLVTPSKDHLAGLPSSRWKRRNAYQIPHVRIAAVIGMPVATLTTMKSSTLARVSVSQRIAARDKRYAAQTNEITEKTDRKVGEALISGVNG